MKESKKSSPQIDKRIAALAGRLSELKKSDTGRLAGVPLELRREAIALLGESALSLRKFSARIGMSRQAMCSWRQVETRLKKKKKRFREVRVVPEKGVERAQVETRSFELALAGGAKITGLSLEDVTRLLSVQGVVR